MLRPFLSQTIFNRQCLRICLRTFHEDSYTPVQEFYKDKSVLVTGATGFVGQGLIEKLLRSCPEIHRIYIPIRTKGKGDTSQRYRKFLDNKVFDTLRATNYDIEHKVVPLPATLEDSKLGLSDETWDKVREEVSVIFHVAALVKLNPPLKEAIDSNVLVATNVFRFGKQCPNLEVYIHVSSLYTHVDLDYIEEKMYPTTLNADQLIEISRHKSKLLRNYRKIVGKSPGTYFATKKVGEYQTALEGGHVPVGIMRLGKVCPSWKEPVPAWSHGHASYLTWMNFIDRGDAFLMLGTVKHKEEMIPADLCSNSLINTAWYLGTNRGGGHTKDPLVVHVQSNPKDTYNTQELVDTVNRCLDKDGRPANVLLLTRAEIFRRVALPALNKGVQDLIKGEKPWSLMMLLFFMVDKGIYTVQFKNNPKQHGNLDIIENALSDQDKKNFPTDILKVDWDEYVAQWLGGLKKAREEKALKEKVQHTQT